MLAGVWVVDSSAGYETESGRVPTNGVWAPSGSARRMSLTTLNQGYLLRPITAGGARHGRAGWLTVTRCLLTS